MKKTIRYLLICAVLTAMLLWAAPVFAEPGEEPAFTEAATESSEALQEEHEEAKEDPEPETNSEPEARPEPEAEPEAESEQEIEAEPVPESVQDVEPEPDVEKAENAPDEVTTEDPQGSESQAEPCQHVYVKELTAPTYELEGRTVYICSLCGDSYEETMPMLEGVPILVGSARCTETGSSDTYGAPGDQTGHEVETQDWYLHEKGWVVIRPIDPWEREMIAQDMEAACSNPHIGYCKQEKEHDKLFYASESLDYDCSLVNVPVNTDCSRLVRVCLWYAGIEVPKFYTRDQVKTLETTGRFEILTDPVYTESPACLLRGDILVTKTSGHTVVVLENGPWIGSADHPEYTPAVIKQTLGIFRQPVDVVALGKGSAAAVSVKAKGEGLTYSWYKRDPEETEFTRTGVTSASYAAVMTEENSGRQVYCVITDEEGNSIRTDTVVMTYVDAVPQVRTQPTNEVVRSNTTAVFSVKADGVETYQWYYRTSSKGSWKKSVAASGKTSNYSVNATSAKNGYQYRCKLTNGTGSVYTSIVKLTVVTAKPSISKQPVNKTVKAGKTVTFKVTAKGRALSYQWYYRTSSKDAWKVVTVSGGTKASCSFTAAQSMKGYQYRCIVKNLKGSATSRTVKLTVK